MPRAQPCRLDPAAIAVLRGPPKGPLAAPLDHIERVAEKKLSVDPAIRRIVQPVAGHQAHSFGRHVGLGRDRAPQGFVGYAPVEDQKPPVRHPSIPGKASNKARIPCPAPPLGRPGSALGVQPKMSKCM